MAEKRISKLAICSLILSASSIFLWFSWIPGIMCGHLARARIQAHPDLTGNNLARIGLVIGYFFPTALCVLVLYLCGYLERQVTMSDQGRIVWEGRFPPFANRPDHVLTPVILHHTIVGTVESRDHNLRLVLKRTVDSKEFTLWRYLDYGRVSKITVDEAKQSLMLYYNQTFLRNKQYNTVVSLIDFSIKKHLVHRGQWRL